MNCFAIAVYTLMCSRISNNEVARHWWNAPLIIRVGDPYALIWKLNNTLVNIFKRKCKSYKYYLLNNDINWKVYDTHKCQGHQQYSMYSPASNTCTSQRVRICFLPLTWIHTYRPFTPGSHSRSSICPLDAFPEYRDRQRRFFVSLGLRLKSFFVTPIKKSCRRPPERIRAMCQCQ